jgi:hypothetical protein
VRRQAALAVPKRAFELACIQFLDQNGDGSGVRSSVRMTGGVAGTAAFREDVAIEGGCIAAFRARFTDLFSRD